MKNETELTTAKLHQKGEDLANRDCLDEAITVYLEILALNEFDLDAIVSLGNIAFHQGRILDAVKYYLNASKINPENNELVMSVSCMLMDAGYPAEAGKLTDAFFAGDFNLLKQKIKETENLLNLK